MLDELGAEILPRLRARLEAELPERVRLREAEGVLDELPAELDRHAVAGRA